MFRFLVTVSFTMNLIMNYNFLFAAYAFSAPRYKLKGAVSIKNLSLNGQSQNNELLVSKNGV